MLLLSKGCLVRLTGECLVTSQLLEVCCLSVLYASNRLLLHYMCHIACAAAAAAAAAIQDCTHMHHVITSSYSSCNEQ